MNKEPKPIIQQINQKCFSMHTRMDEVLTKLDKLNEEINILKKHVLDLNYRMPERKQGWLGGYWDNDKGLAKVDWEKLQK